MNMFESSVIYDGTKPNPLTRATAEAFESSVIYDGTKPL